MIKQLRRGALLVVAALSVAVWSGPIAGAQTNNSAVANGFRISPVRSELTIEKGKSETLTISVENPTQVPTTARLIVNDFVAGDDESGAPALILDENAQAPRNSFKKLVGPLNNISLGPNEKKDITVKLSIPADARAGGYYGAIRFVPNADVRQEGTNVGLTASVGSIVLITVPGNLVQKVDLVQLSAQQNGEPKSFFTNGPVGVMARLKNSGDIHAKPFGRVEVKDMFGKVVTTYEFNETEPRSNILPDSTRRFDKQLDQKKWFGRYTIQASLGYVQGGGDLMIAKSSFWYVPAGALYALLGALLAIALAAWWFIRRSQGKKALMRVRLRRKKR
jgi:hypothetical protein